jgi:hypothetical protein
MYLYVSLCISCAYRMYLHVFFAAKSVRRTVHTDTYNTYKIHTKYIQNTYKIHANTCTTFKGTLHAVLYVLVCICMYHVCILGGVHIVCTSMYLFVSVCIVHMEPCTTQVHICMYHCMCLYQYVSYVSVCNVCICMYCSHGTLHYCCMYLCVSVYICMYWYVSACIVHMEPCTTLVCICMYQCIC